VPEQLLIPAGRLLLTLNSNDPDPVTSEPTANNNLEDVANSNTEKNDPKNKSLKTTTKDQ
jgi:hypothetical protein